MVAGIELCMDEIGRQAAGREIEVIAGIAHDTGTGA
jgi:hypothetical protein